MKILKVILSKLRANNRSGYPDYKLRQVVFFSDDKFDLTLPFDFQANSMTLAVAEKQ